MKALTADEPKDRALAHDEAAPVYLRVAVAAGNQADRSLTNWHLAKAMPFDCDVTAAKPSDWRCTCRAEPVAIAKTAPVEPWLPGNYGGVTPHRTPEYRHLLCKPCAREKLFTQKTKCKQLKI
jgi:hypothetical protein